ncbi:PiggyBac transposable element-derived protein 3 [Trichinella pseudospiralis]|uniref:PiggyBac transposable element-derived protein 3 n=1 Tax=Trichinella pseudospiralis TaxID=6337 RepID=A0A0V1EA56_TRIPS
MHTSGRKPCSVFPFEEKISSDMSISSSLLNYLRLIIAYFNLEFIVFHGYLSIDKSMIPYFGHHFAKMYNEGKFIRFGYKIWMLCSSDDYSYYIKKLAEI